MGVRTAIGNAINKISGTTSSARQQYQTQMALQKDAQEFSKWQMANAHQMEVQDLQNAGLNPVLSAGGTGASAGITEGSASAGISNGNPIDTIISLANTAKSMEKTDAEIKKIESETNLNKQTQKNGGNGGTPFVRNMTWMGNQITTAKKALDKKLEEIANKGKQLSWKDFKNRLKK